MQEKLIIYMHAKALDRPSWVIIDHNKRVKNQEEYGEPHQLVALAKNRIVEVYVPAQDVLLTEVTLQAMSRLRIKQALPYALEDQLIDDVDQLHFAMGQQALSELPVAVVSHAKMKEWLQQLSAWLIEPDALFSNIYCLPWVEGAWQLVLRDELMIVRTSENTGFAVEAINFIPLLNLATVRPKRLIYYAETKELPFKENVIPVEYRAIKNKEWLLTDTDHLAGVAVNLLQGPYAIKHSMFFQKNNLIKLSLYLFITWVMLGFAYPIGSYFLLFNKARNIHSQISEIYYYHFPKASSVIAPQLRMTDKLKKLQSGENDQVLFTYLAYLGQAINQTSSINLKRLLYQQDQLTIELSAANTADFSRFISFLTKQGLDVKQQNANFTGTDINATILIR